MSRTADLIARLVTRDTNRHVWYTKRCNNCFVFVFTSSRKVTNCTRKAYARQHAMKIQGLIIGPLSKQRRSFHFKSIHRSSLDKARNVERVVQNHNDLARARGSGVGSASTAYLRHTFSYSKRSWPTYFMNNPSTIESFTGLFSVYICSICALNHFC